MAITTKNKLTRKAIFQLLGNRVFVLLINTNMSESYVILTGRGFIDKYLLKKDNYLPMKSIEVRKTYV